jgi:exopolysaccharide production protein ExoZ
MATQRKFDSVQVLRAVAAIVVLVHHTNAIEKKYTSFDWLSFFGLNGRYGVDLFFAISGFIITYTALRRVGREGAGFEFLRHRALRIFPVYWEFTLLVLAVFFVKPEWINNSAHIAPDIVGSFLLIAPESRLLNAVGWTLTFEVYFYLVFSLIFLCGRRWLPLLWLFWANGVVWCGIAASQLMPDNYFFHVAASPLVLEFILGSIVGWWVLNNAAQPRLALPALILAVVYIIAVYPYAQTLPLDVSRTVLCAFPCALIVFAAANAERFFENTFWKPWLLIGNASYSLYLSHVLVVAALGRLSAKLLPGLNAFEYALWLLLCWTIAVAVGIGNYWVVERPLLALLRRKSATI